MKKREISEAPYLDRNTLFMINPGHLSLVANSNSQYLNHKLSSFENGFSESVEVIQWLNKFYALMIHETESN